MVVINQLKKTYDSFTLNLDLQLPEGRVTGLIGRNGAGKSTTIKAVLGLIRPDEGNVSVFGKNTDTLTAEDKEAIGVAFSNSGFSSYLSINDMIRILRRMYRSFDEAWFRNACINGNLPFDKRLKEFSTGMNARLKVLVACCHNAKLLILDEPTAGLDVVARNEILDLLRSYLAEDSTRSMLISSHISTDLEGLCDDLYMIHNGKLVFHEETDIISSEYALLKVPAVQLPNLDRQYILSTREESYGYVCLTNRRHYYSEIYPNMIIEPGSIDDLIIMMAKEEA